MELIKGCGIYYCYRITTTDGCFIDYCINPSDLEEG